MAIGKSTLDCLLVATSRELYPSTECWLGVGDPCKDSITSPIAKSEVILLTMSISLSMLSWAGAPHDLAARVTASKISSSTTGVASYTKSSYKRMEN